MNVRTLAARKSIKRNQQIQLKSHRTEGWERSQHFEIPETIDAQ